VYRCQYYSSYKLYICQKVKKGHWPFSLNSRFFHAKLYNCSLAWNLLAACWTNLKPSKVYVCTMGDATKTSNTR
jgi:hypothetical protein